jgi:hypothetical protein
MEFGTHQIKPFKLAPSLCQVKNSAKDLHLYMCNNLGITGKCQSTFTEFLAKPSTYLLTPHFGHCCTLDVATLALGLQPKQGFAKVWTKTRPDSHISCSCKCKRMWGNEPSHSQMNSHFGSWIPNGFPNFQRVIARVKIYWIEKFLISLESSWSVNVWNGLAWPIWTPKTQVMAKRKVGSQINNLTPDH